MLHITVLLSAASAVLISQTSQGSPLNRAIAMLEAGQVEEARDALETIRRGGPYALEDVLELYRNLGIARAYLGDTKGARWAFERLLAFSPGAMLRYTVSPKATFVFQQVRDAMEAHPALRLDIAAPPAPCSTCTTWSASRC